MRAPLVLCALVACAHAQPPQADVTATSAVADAVKLIRAGKLDAAEQRLAAEREKTREDPRRLEQIDYYLATVLSFRGDLVAAAHLLAAHAQAAAERRDPESTVWMSSSLAWVLWARGDVDGALLSLRRGAVAVEDLDEDAHHAWGLKLLWERAFFLVDGVGSAEPEARDAARKVAAEARAELETAGKDDHDARDALAAYAQLREGDAPGAAATARKVHLDADSDSALAYAVALVLDAAGDREQAARIRARAGAKIGLLTPLFAKRAAR
jgi:hypothetical protein